MACSLLGTRHSALGTYFSAALAAISYFEKKPALAVAVSGGADSMALLLLTHAWATARGGKVAALTVDHGLRKESAAEARQVARWCRARGIRHHILKWAGGKKSQSAAREARYALLTGWCRKHGVLHLMTAHHQGDQAETLLLRLSRGSFIEGLAAIPAVSFRDGVRLVRPLLSLPKSALKEFLRGNNQPWVEDPSNLNPRYARNRLRAHINEKTAARAAALAARFGIIRRELEHSLAAAMARAVELRRGAAFLKEAEFRLIPADQATRLLSALIQALSGMDLPPRSEQVRLLYQELTSARPPKRRSLCHCEFKYRPERQGWGIEYCAAAHHIKSAKPAKPLAGQAFLGLNTAHAQLR